MAELDQARSLAKPQPRDEQLGEGLPMHAAKLVDGGEVRLGLAVMTRKATSSWHARSSLREENTPVQ